MGYFTITAFVSLFTFGTPIVVAIALPSIAYILLMGFPIEMIAQRMHYALDSYTMMAVPLFIFAGNLMNNSGITSRIFRFADSLMGATPGGLAQVNIFGSLIFAGMSGSALADIGGLGQIEIKAMNEKGFERSFTAAVTCASATVGPIFPPSIPIIVYCGVTGDSAIKLLLAGAPAAILCTLAMMILTGFLAIKRKYPRPRCWPKLSIILNDFWNALPALLSPVLLVFGMLGGFFTPTEAAAVTVVYILAINILIYRDLNMRSLYQAAVTTIQLSSQILILYAAAQLFGWVLTIEHIPQKFASMVLLMSNNPTILLLLLNIMLLIVGMFMSGIAAIVLIVPIIAPPLIALGIDPIHLGIVIVLNLEIGLITPPMGMSLFLVSELADVSMSKLLKDLLPFYVPLILVLLLITYVPQMVMWLPNFVK